MIGNGSGKVMWYIGRPEGGIYHNSHHCIYYIVLVKTIGYVSVTSIILYCIHSVLIVCHSSHIIYRQAVSM